jgi:transcriptional regulator with XRE-family HTH domain
MTPIQRIYAGLGFTDKSRQREFAELAEVSQATASRWLNGKDEPKLERIIRLRQRAKKLGYPWSDAWIFDQQCRPKKNGKGASQ